MRIYNKRNFAAGILSLALAVACGVVLAVTGFQTKWLIALVLLLAAGGFDLWWSLSRESRLPRVDERDQAVSRKSAWLAYRIVANGCWIVSLWNQPDPGSSGGDHHAGRCDHRGFCRPAGG